MAKDQVQVDELLDEEEVHVEEGHDAVNAEKKSVDSVDKAAKTGPSGKKRPADKSNAENGGKAYKSDKGIVRELYNRMNGMTNEELRALHDVMMDEDFSIEEFTSEEADVLEDVTYDMSPDIADLVETEATLSEDFKDKASVIMEMAVKSKLTAEIARLEESYDEQLTEATDEMVTKIDSYLNYVVENWMEENELAVQNGLRTEIAEGFMTGLKDLFTESYITVPEDKVELVDDLAEQVEALETELNEGVDRMITMAEELEGFQRDAVIYEMCDDLADTQIDKLAKLSENVDFDDVETFTERLTTIKETYFGSKSKPKQTAITEENDLEETDEVEISSTMAGYVKSLRKSAD